MTTDFNKVLLTRLVLPWANLMGRVKVGCLMCVGVQPLKRRQKGKRHHDMGWNY